MLLSEKSSQIQTMFDKIAPRYDFLNHLLSARQDVRWRKYLVKKLPKVAENNGTLYDVACGTGDVLFTSTAKRLDYKNFIGFDISEQMLVQARKKQSGKNIGTNNIEFVQASAEKLPVDTSSADAVTIAFGLRNVDARAQALQEFHRVLKSGGKLFVLEFFSPDNNFLAKIFNIYFNKVLPKIGGIFSDKQAYQYLPSSVASMPSATTFKDILVTTGFTEVQEKTWLAGATRLFIAKK